jgi:hypothetical protein
MTSLTHPRTCQGSHQTADLIASLHAVEGMFVEWRRLERTGLRRAQEAVAPLFERKALIASALKALESRTS